MPGSSGLGYHGNWASPRAVSPRASRADVVAAPEYASAAPPTVGSDVPRRTLIGWNVAMFLFHAALAATTLLVGNRDLLVDVYKTTVEVRWSNASSSATAWRLVPRYLPAGELPFTWLVAAFFLLSAGFHLGNATVWRRFYLAELAACRTPTRWCEYALSAPVMIVLIAYTLGVRDRMLLLALAALTAATMPFGYWTEVHGRPASADAWAASRAWRLLPWALGHVPQLAAWVPIVVQFYDPLVDGVPAFVHAILWGELALFLSFGLASLLSQLGPPRLFYRGELLFQTLSLAAKGLLGGLLIGNVLMLSRFEDLYEA